MQTFSLKSLKTRTIRNKFNIIVGLIIVILLFGLLNFWLSTKIMSGIRAYVGGEGLWSKAQKESVNNLIKYSYTGDESDYNDYLKFIQVPMGDRRARLELNLPKPNHETIKSGFVQGGNNPNDVKDLTFLYRRFRSISYMKSAIQIWTKGDEEILNLVSTGNQVHALVSSRSPANPVAQKARSVELSNLRKQVYAIDARLTVLENQFSATLGEGSRGISSLLLQVTILVTGLLGVLTLVIAVLIAKAIIRLDHLKTELISLASHQLRTPLTSINWYAESLLSESVGKLNRKQKDYLNELYDGGQRMASLISDLLKVSSLDLGTYVPEIRSVNVAKIVENIVKDEKLYLNQKGILLNVAIDPNLPRVNMDEQLLTIVLQNLLSNSVKYTRRGGQIGIEVQYKKPNVLIHVRDNGIGIPKKQQSQVFTKLFRAENAKELSTIGTGLGLYMVKAMVGRMGGSIRFDSNENEGTRFYVKLRVYEKAGSGAKKGQKWLRKS